MLINNLKADLQSEINRLGVSPNILGDTKGVLVIDSEDSEQGYELGDENQGSVDLDIEATLFNLRKLPDGAGIDHFWSAVVDADTEE